MIPADRDAFLAFFRAAAALKDTLRSGFTPAGRPESTAEHTWRLCLIAITLDDALGVDLRRLLELLVVHDLAEAVVGDVPAPLQQPATRPPTSAPPSPASSPRCRRRPRRG